MNKKPKILLIISGSIAAYKTVDLLRKLRQGGNEVKVVLTAAASQLVSPMSLHTVNGGHVFQNNDQETDPLLHISLAKWPDRILIAPASADFIAKYALGLASDLASSVLLATTAQVFLAPAMNKIMWEKWLNQKYISRLKKGGCVVMGPGQGEQACGDWGDGRMLEPFELAAAFGPQKSYEKTHKVLLTAGPTFEAMDPVRGFTNKSTGRMAYALAEAFGQMGCEVCLVHGPTPQPPPVMHTNIAVTTALQMHKAVMENIAEYDVFVAAAAVADYRPEQSHSSKLKKGDDKWQITLVKNPDILCDVAKKYSDIYKVAFALETHSSVQDAEKKRQRKAADMLLLNSISTHHNPLGSDDNQITLLQEGQCESWPLMSKTALAERLVHEVLANLEVTVAL